jgi:type VI protein secretion system component VasK
MADPGAPILEYQRPRPRRRWWILFAVAMLVFITFVGIERWRAYRVRLEDRKLMLEQRKIREEFDREMTKWATTRAATQPSK